MGARAELDAYLRVLAGETPNSSFMELRYRVAPDTLAAEFLPAHDRRALTAAIERRARITDVYVGCAPRARRSGKKRDVAEVWVLWAECDGAAAAVAAQRYDPEPAIVIASGSGPNVHAYWPLREPLTPQETERANLRLAHALSADRACYDAARILRPPATWNHKHAPPAAVTAVRLDVGTRFDASHVLLRAPEIEAELLRRRWIERGERHLRRDPLLQVAPAVYVSELLGVQAHAGRKVRCPFHSDEHPSLHVYPSAAQGWCCFSCGRGGSIYDLGAAVWGMGTRGRDFVELKRTLGQRFLRDLGRSGQTLGHHVG